MVAKKLASAAMGLFILTAAYSPAFAGSASVPVQGAVQAPVSNGSVAGGLNSVFADSVQHPTAKACKQDTLYSQHDVIGDPESCIMNRFDARMGSVGGIGGMAVAP